MKTKMFLIISLIASSIAAHAMTLDCAIGTESAEDKHVRKTFVENSGDLNLGKAAQFQVTASALGKSVVIVAQAGEQWISSSDLPRANLRIQTSATLAEYTCEVK